MTPPTYLYVRVYVNKNGKRIFYSGITDNMIRRQKEHNDGKCRTTNKMNKSYGLPVEIFYVQIKNAEHYEKMFKRYTTRKKELIIKGYLRINNYAYISPIISVFRRWAG